MMLADAAYYLTTAQGVAKVLGIAAAIVASLATIWFSAVKPGRDLAKRLALKWILVPLRDERDRRSKLYEQSEWQTQMLGKAVGQLFPEGGKSLNDQVADNRRTAREHAIRIAVLEGMSSRHFARCPEAAYVTDAAGDVLDVSDEFTRLTGLDLDAVQRGGIRACVHPADQPAFAAEWASARRTGERFSADFRIVRRDLGTMRFVHSFGEAILDDGRRIQRWYVAIEPAAGEPKPYAPDGAH